jgi:hypothetical protein
VPDGIVYIVFPNSAARPRWPRDATEMADKAHQLLTEFGGPALLKFCLSAVATGEQKRATWVRNGSASHLGAAALASAWPEEAQRLATKRSPIGQSITCVVHPTDRRRVRGFRRPELSRQRSMFMFRGVRLAAGVRPTGASLVAREPFTASCASPFRSNDF